MNVAACGNITTEINERTQLPFRFSTENAAGGQVTPSTLRWRVDCLTTNLEALTWQTANAVPVYDGVVPASANVIKNNANHSETKRLTVEANAGLDTQWTEFADYVVINNRFVT